jgi:hypothetical protein
MMLRGGKRRNGQNHYYRYRKATHDRTFSRCDLCDHNVSLHRKMRPGRYWFQGLVWEGPQGTGVNFVHRCSSLRARGLRPVLELFPCWGMCYNRPAVEQAVKPGAAPVRTEPAESESSQLAPRAEHTAMAPSEDASRYCPVCSQRLESRRCKLICSVCGYYMSCADYY